MQRSPLLAAVALSLGPVLFAQGPAHLVALTRNVPSLRVLGLQNCTQVDQCAPIVFPLQPPMVQGAGGVDWDPTNRAAWVTDGTLLAQVDEDCNVVCPMQVVPSLTGGQLTGLEVVESRRRLFAIDSAGFLHQFSLGCPPVPQAVCQTGLLSASSPLVPTGIAVDEGLGLVFYALTDFATHDNAIAVASLTDPCTVLQRIPVQPCPNSTLPFRSFEGLAVDWCGRRIFATDGDRTMRLDYQPGIVGIAITGQQCCTPPVLSLDFYTGIAYRPGRETPFGASCSNGLCPNCPMRHSLLNDPNVGNGRFATRTTGVPVSLVWNLIGLGSCNAAPVVPPLCGPVYTNPLADVFGPVLPAHGALGPCDGVAVFSLGLPLDPYFCGIVVSSQALALCFDQSGAFGTSMSNCISFELQGN